MHLRLAPPPSGESGAAAESPSVPIPRAPPAYVLKRQAAATKARAAEEAAGRRLAGFKLRVHSCRWVRANNEYWPASEQAYSYGWWRFVERIGPYLVFNDYSYSPTTRRHQSDVRSLLWKLGVQIDLQVEAPRGLQDLDSATAHYTSKIRSLEAEIATPRTRKAKNVARRAEIARLEHKITQVEELIRLRASAHRAEATR